jgi:hypothetical protein
MQDITQCSTGKKYVTKIPIAMYGCTLHFIITTDVAIAVNKLYKKFKYEDEVFSDLVEGCLITFDIDAYYVFIECKYLTFNTLSHELYHATVKITEDRGIEDEEQRAWLCGWMTERVYSFIRKKELTISNG